MKICSLFLLGLIGIWVGEGFIHGTPTSGRLKFNEDGSVFAYLDMASPNGPMSLFAKGTYREEGAAVLLDFSSGKIKLFGQFENATTITFPQTGAEPDIRGTITKEAP